MIKLAVVDDKRVMRFALSDKIKAAGDMQLLFLAEDGAVFLEEMKNRDVTAYPDIVLMDIDMPNLNGIETVSLAKAIYPSIEFIMLTVFDEDTKIFEAIRAGATGYLLKDESTTALLQAIRDVHTFHAVPFSPVIARKALQLFSKMPVQAEPMVITNPLSDRETTVLKGLVNGLDYRRIAEQMGVSPNTIRNHIANIYQKLHVSNKVDAVKIALKKNWV